jgi:2-aminoadipate transaminase
LSLRDDSWTARPHYAGWLGSTNNITQQFLAIGGIPDIISLAGGLPAAELYPVEEIRQASDRALTRWGSQALEYGPVEGFPALRLAIAERMSQATGGTFKADNVLITSGAAQGLDLIGKLFLDRGDLAVVQHPTYLGALDAWRPREPSYEKLTWDLDAPGFEDRLKAAKFVYAVPNYSNPTGVLVPEAARQRLLSQVAGAGTWLVEDDPYLPLQLDGKAGRSLLSMAASREPYDGPVIYLGTLSKSIVPGLRVGWVIAPADLVQALALTKQSSDLSSSMLTHVIALALLESGFEPGHVEKTVAAYRERRDALMQAAARHLSQWFDWDTPPGGMFAWLNAKSQAGRALIDTDRLYHHALAEKVAFVPSSVFDFEGRLNSAMRLNFTRSSPEAIGEGIARLRLAVERYLAETNERRPARTASGDNR